jgi:hypothetical protein
MLSKILEEISGATPPVVNKVDLARRLDVEESALEGMLDALVNQGKLKKVKDMTIEQCEAQLDQGIFKSGLCAFLTHGSSATYYELVEPQKQP